MSQKKYLTEQEEFWAGNFGDEYIERNKSDRLLASNISFFSKALKIVGPLTSCIEVGANVGMNLKAIKLLYPSTDLHAIEINEKAASQLATVIGANNVFNGSVLEFFEDISCDLVLIKGVLIHINPDMLNQVYEKLYQISKRYILICEYYNRVPTTVSYRGHDNRLYKRDFAGDILDKYQNLRLVDYGFVYHRDEAFPQDDISWFLLEKG